MQPYSIPAIALLLALAGTALADEMKDAEKTLVEEMSLLKTRECKHELQSSIDWPSFGNTADHRFESGGRISIGGSCAIETGLSYFCKTHSPQPIQRLRKFVCVFEKASDDPFFKQYGFRLSVEGDTIRLFTNLNAVNMDDHLDEWLAANLKVGEGGQTFATQKAKDEADATLAEGMSSLAKGECKHSLKTEIDWSSFGDPARHVFDHGAQISIGGSCDLHTELSSFCRTHGNEAVKKLDTLVCKFQTESRDPFFKEYGFTLGVDGSTLTLYTNLQARNVYIHAPEWLEEHLGPAGTKGRSFKVQKVMDDSDQALADEMARMKGGPCEHALAAEIDWKSFGNPLDHKFDNGANISIHGSCDVRAAFDSYCGAKGSKKIKRFKKFKCVFKKSGNKKFAKTGMAMKAKGKTLVFHTNMLAGNREDWVDSWLRKNL